MNEQALPEGGVVDDFALRPAFLRGLRRLKAVIKAARRRQRRRRFALAVTLIVTAAVAIYFSVGHGGTSPTTNTRTGLAVARFPLHGGPVALATADGSVWVVLETSRQRAELVRLNSATGHRIASYPIGRSGPDFGAATADGGVIYATAGNHLIRVDPQHSSGIARINIPGEGAALTVGYGSVWVASIRQAQAHYTITRADTLTLAHQSAIPVSVQPVALRAGLGSIWLASTSGLWRISPTTNRVRPTGVSWQGPVGSTLSSGRLWIMQRPTLLTGVDYAGRIRNRIDLPFYPGDIAASGRNLWVTNNCGCKKGLVALVDSRTGRVASERQIGETPVAITTDRKGAWVATFGDGSVSHVVETR
jgi:hypothetical protein